VPICFSREVREEQEMMDSATAQAWVKAKYTQQAVTSRPETKSRGSGFWKVACWQMLKTGSQKKKNRQQRQKNEITTKILLHRERNRQQCEETTCRAGGICKPFTQQRRNSQSIQGTQTTRKEKEIIWLKMDKIKTLIDISQNKTCKQPTSVGKNVQHH
jgi:hypothetical protein